MTLYGEHLHAEEQSQVPHCQTCKRRASVEVFGASGRSYGCFCVRCGRRKIVVLDRMEAAFPLTKEVEVS